MLLQDLLVHGGFIHRLDNRCSLFRKKLELITYLDLNQRIKLWLPDTTYQMGIIIIKQAADQLRSTIRVSGPPSYCLGSLH